MTKDEALKLALEALESFQEISDFTPAQAVHAITAIKEALAQPDAFEQGRQEGMKQERALWTLTKVGQEIEAQTPTHTINTNHAVAVATATYWLPIDKDTPRSVKLQLLSIGGVAQYGTLGSDPTFFTHWCPAPKKPK